MGSGKEVKENSDTIINLEITNQAESGEYLAGNSEIRELERKMKEGYTSTEEFKDTIYELMNGSFALSHCDIPESVVVKDEFEEGLFCAQAYEDIYEAKKRLCERLGVESDQDIELLLYKMQEISRHLCFKMYDYGKFFTFLSNK